MSLVQTVACSRVVRHYKLKWQSRKMANNRKIQLKNGLKTVHYIAEVKRKTINRNFVKKNMISAHKTDKYGAMRRQDLTDGGAK